MSDTSLCEVSDLTVVVCEALCQILCYAIPWPVSNGTAELSQILRYAKYLTVSHGIVKSMSNKFAMRSI